MAENMRREEFLQTLENIKSSINRTVESHGLEVCGLSVESVEGKFSIRVLFSTSDTTFMSEDQLKSKETNDLFDSIVSGLEDPEKVEIQTEKLRNDAEQQIRDIDNFFD